MRLLLSKLLCRNCLQRYLGFDADVYPRIVEKLRHSTTFCKPQSLIEPPTYMHAICRACRPET